MTSTVSVPFFGPLDRQDEPSTSRGRARGDALEVHGAGEHADGRAAAAGLDERLLGGAGRELRALVGLRGAAGERGAADEGDGGQCGQGDWRGLFMVGHLLTAAPSEPHRVRSVGPRLLIRTAAGLLRRPEPVALAQREIDAGCGTVSRAVVGASRRARPAYGSTAAAVAARVGPGGVVGHW